MRKTLFACVAILLLGAQMSHASTPPSFWQDLRDLVVRCTVQNYKLGKSGRFLALPLQSKCESELRKIGPSEARFVLNGEELVATIEESEESDGGDLVNLTILNADGEVIERVQNVLAFNDVLLALALGDHEGIEKITP